MIDLDIINVNYRYYSGEVRVQAMRYASNGGLAIRLFSDTDGPVATASVNIEDQLPTGPAQFWMKDYSENEGLKAELVKAGVIEDEGTTIPAGYASVDLVTLTPKYAELIKWEEGS